MDTSAPTWLLYGAYGFTGRLITEQAVALGERPILAGRNERELAALAAETGLQHRAVPLDRAEPLRQALEGVSAVLHAAGPFTRTYRPMAEACLATGTHYLDITGEIDVLEGLSGLSGRARDAGVALLPGVGFDVVPTDCAAALAAASVHEPTHLEIAFHSTGGPSRGTARSAIEHMDAGQLERREGRVVPVRSAAPFRVPFSDRARAALPISWGDVVTAAHSTGVPNVRVYMAAPPEVVRLARLIRRARALARVPGARALLRLAVDRMVAGPDERELAEGRSRVWCRARAEGSGQTAVVELVTPNGYTLTARSAVAAVRALLSPDDEGRPRTGFLTPSLAFGAGFAETLEGVERVAGGGS